VLRKTVRLPGYAADSWALGCLAYFCLHGRPKFYGDTDQVGASIRYVSQQRCLKFQVFSLFVAQVLDQIWQETQSKQDASAVHFEEEKGTEGDTEKELISLQDAAAADFVNALNLAGLVPVQFALPSLV
jgi:serine/threonine protein kinase